MKGIAQLLQKYGRNGDKLLAHITPEEANMLKRRGGAGTTNPVTGLPEFYESYEEWKRATNAAHEARQSGNQDLSNRILSGHLDSTPDRSYGTDAIPDNNTSSSSGGGSTSSSSPSSGGGGVQNTSSSLSSSEPSSPQTTNSTPSQGINDLVSEIYQKQFGRTPGDAGMEYWAGRVQSGDVSKDNLQEYIINAASQGDKDRTVSKAYEDFFGRNPDNPGQNFYNDNWGSWDGDIRQAIANAASQDDIDRAINTAVERKFGDKATDFDFKENRGALGSQSDYLFAIRDQTLRNDVVNFNEPEQTLPGITPGGGLGGGNPGSPNDPYPDSGSGDTIDPIDTGDYTGPPIDHGFYINDPYETDPVYGYNSEKLWFDNPKGMPLLPFQMYDDAVIKGDTDEEDSDVKAEDETPLNKASGGEIRKDADRLEEYGRQGDTILAHINPTEARILKALGGSGTINPKTGLPEFISVGGATGHGSTGSGTEGGGGDPDGPSGGNDSGGGGGVSPGNVSPGGMNTGGSHNPSSETTGPSSAAEAGVGDADSLGQEQSDARAEQMSRNEAQRAAQQALEGKEFATKVQALRNMPKPPRSLWGAANKASNIAAVADPRSLAGDIAFSAATSQLPGSSIFGAATSIANALDTKSPTTGLLGRGLDAIGLSNEPTADTVQGMVDDVNAADMSGIEGAANSGRTGDGAEIANEQVEESIGVDQEDEDTKITRSILTDIMTRSYNDPYSGATRKLADGGSTHQGKVNGPGTSTSDSIPARLSVGEYVVPEAMVRDIGGGNHAQGIAALDTMRHKSLKKRGRM